MIVSDWIRIDVWGVNVRNRWRFVGAAIRFLNFGNKSTGKCMGGPSDNVLIFLHP